MSVIFLGPPPANTYTEEKNFSIFWATVAWIFTDFYGSLILKFQEVRRFIEMYTNAQASGS